MTGQHRERRADVIIVGGGITGCCVAIHLLDLGVGRVLIIESGDVAAGTTPAGAGFVGLWAAGYGGHPGVGELTLQRYGIAFYRKLAESEGEIGFRGSGSLFLAMTKKGWERDVRTIAEHPLAPPDLQVLEPAEVADLTGIVPATEVFRGVLHPDGIQIDAGPATEALARRVRTRGGDIRTHVEVEELDIDAGRVRGVRTSAGVLRSSAVIVCAGAWTNQVLEAVGWQIPLLPVVASRVVTRDLGVTQTMPTMLIPEVSGLWVREHHGGLTYGNGYGYEQLNALVDGYPRRRPSFPQLVENMRKRLGDAPSSMLRGMAQAPVAAWYQGIPCYTTDRRFLAGPVPGTDGLFVIAGCNEGGVTHGPGLGRLVAELVAEGSASIVDAAPYRLDRFDRSEDPLSPT